MLAIAKEMGVPSGISTNATILTEESSRRLIQAGLDYIIFAFDGATKATYEKYRKGAEFEKVRENILGFLKVKKELKSKIFCIVQMVRAEGEQPRDPGADPDVACGRRRRGQDQEGRSS